MIAGIDFSTKAVDVVLLDEDTDAASWHRFELQGQDAFDRARDVRQSWSSLWDDVLAVGIEQPQARGPRAARMGDLYRIQGAVLACLPRTLLVQPWWPSEWRKTVGLSGNASKADVWKHAIGLMANDNGVVKMGWPQDACDAYCIALATRQRLEIGAAA